MRSVSINRAASLMAAACAAALFAGAANAQSQAQSSPQPDPSAGRFIFDSRARFESVDQANLSKDAEALTVRTRLGFETPAVSGFRVLVEGAIVVAPIDRYYDTVHPNPGYPSIPDPINADLNRAQIEWKGPMATDIVVGRQRIGLNNERFVGPSGWRQTEQTFDAVKIATTPVEPLTLTYVFIDRVHRVVGPDSPQGVWRGDTDLFQADLKTPVGKLSAYGYLLEFDNAPTQSTQTWGARLTGGRKLEQGLSVTWEAEYARQHAWRNNPATFDLDYVALGAGLKADRWTLSAGLERLGSDGAHGFQTPLATAHPFQGWSDVLGANAPASGVLDLNAHASVVLPQAFFGKPLKLVAGAYDFAPVKGSGHIGHEFDAGVSVPLTKRLTADAQAAVFHGDAAAYPDTRKLWFILNWSY